MLINWFPASIVRPTQSLPQPTDVKWKEVMNWLLNQLCDLDLWSHPWPWPWILKVKFWNSCISGIGGPIDMERKGCHSIIHDYSGCKSRRHILGHWKSSLWCCWHAANLDMRLDMGISVTILCCSDHRSKAIIYHTMFIGVFPRQ